MRELHTAAITILALAASPLVLFVSTSNQLFILNQVDLGYNPAVMYPFLLLAASMWVAGILVYSLSRFQSFHYLLWCYLLSGPFFLLLSSIAVLGNPRPGSLVTILVSGLLLLSSAYLLSNRVRAESAASVFAVFAVLLSGFEGYQYLTQVNRQASESAAPLQARDPAPLAHSLPNVYLLLLDEYQTDMFELTLDESTRRGLGGFQYYPRNTAVYGRTGMSLPSIFSGRIFDTDGSQRKYRDSAFNSEASILYWLKHAGYSQYAFVRDDIRAKFDMGMFDFVEEHEDTRSLSVISNVVEKFAIDAFRDLWIIRYFPTQISSRLLGAERVQALKSGNVLPKSANISSFYGFVRYQQREEELPARSRFTFIYLLLPHFPYVFNRDCGYADDLATTGPLMQSICTTNLVLDFLEELKRLDRFEESLILVLSDHGARFAVGEGRLRSLEGQGSFSEAWSRARSRALLLVKPPGAGGTRPFMTLDFGSTLTDVAPTILDAAGLEIPGDLDGLSLLDPGLAEVDRTRRYYFFDKKGPNGWTDELVRFTVSEDGLSEGERVELQNNPSERPYTYQKRAKQSVLE